MTSSKKTAVAAIAATVAIIAGIALFKSQPLRFNNVETDSPTKEQVFDAEENSGDFIKEAAEGVRVPAEAKPASEHTKIAKVADFETLGLLAPEDEFKAVERYNGFRAKARLQLYSYRERMQPQRIQDRMQEALLAEVYWRYDAILRCISEDEYLTADLKGSGHALDLPGYKVSYDAAIMDGKAVRLILPIPLIDHTEYTNALQGAANIREEYAQDRIQEFNAMSYERRSKYVDLLKQYYKDKSKMNDAERATAKRMQDLSHRLNWTEATFH